MVIDILETRDILKSGPRVVQSILSACASLQTEVVAQTACHQMRNGSNRLMDFDVSGVVRAHSSIGAAATRATSPRVCHYGSLQCRLEAVYSLRYKKENWRRCR